MTDPSFTLSYFTFPGWLNTVQQLLDSASSSENPPATPHHFLRNVTAQWFVSNPSVQLHYWVLKQSLLPSDNFLSDIWPIIQPNINSDVKLYLLRGHTNIGAKYCYFCHRSCAARSLLSIELLGPIHRPTVSICARITTYSSTTLQLPTTGIDPLAHYLSTPLLMNPPSPTTTPPPSDTPSGLLFTNSGPSYESFTPTSNTYTTTVAGPVPRFLSVPIFRPSVPSPPAPQLPFCCSPVSPCNLCPNTSNPEIRLVSDVSHNTPTNPTLFASSTSSSPDNLPLDLSCTSAAASPLSISNIYSSSASTALQRLSSAISPLQPPAAFCIPTSPVSTKVSSPSTSPVPVITSTYSFLVPPTPHRFLPALPQLHPRPRLPPQPLLSHLLDTPPAPGTSGSTAFNSSAFSSLSQASAIPYTTPVPTSSAPGPERTPTIPPPRVPLHAFTRDTYLRYLPPHQVHALEQAYRVSPYLPSYRAEYLETAIGLSSFRIKHWFTKRRRRIQLACPCMHCSGTATTFL
ncbi:unnamed protein product [Orchesella dallaii]|uniref:Homeobox domain-containing protein n=1 Tax=Orchesella dallaii TaxID=48710 RepID=A0ABP1S782_9HEXA